jgi:sugar fermentation stimulation protein A
MEFQPPLIKGTLIKRYKRFLADIQLEKEKVVAFCPNTGSMLSVNTPGSPVYLSISDNPSRKLKYTLELIEIDGILVGINTHYPNLIVASAIQQSLIPELKDYQILKKEVKYRDNVRFDLLLEHKDGSLLYMEIKNVTLKLGKAASFPDAVTTRGQKHLIHLMDACQKGNKALIFYLIQRSDCHYFTVAESIDPKYAQLFKQARRNGVMALAYTTNITEKSIKIINSLDFHTDYK